MNPPCRSRTPRRRLIVTLGLASLAAALAAAGTAANAQGSTTRGSNWPSKPITLVIPFPVGNTADLAARALQQPLSQALGVPVVVDNRAGAGGNLAVQGVARADKDGHTLLLTTLSPLVINPSVFRNPGFDAARDVQAVAAIGSVPMVLITRKDFPARDLPGFVQHVKANADKVSYASVGNGTFTHLGMELFARSIGVKLTHVPYRGAGAAHQDLQGGRIDFMFDSVASSNAQIKADRVQAIATSGSTRSPFLMTTPTVMEAGGAPLRSFDVSVYVGLFAPAGVPAAVVQRLNTEVARQLRNPEFRAQLAGQFIRATDPITPVAFEQIVSAERQRWGQLARQLQLEPQ
jgi:tripartite-type tricarboxylate transporter receptor subunit TctC